MLIDHTFTAKEARAITGGLSKPSKMPGHGYGLPARECITGSKLRAVNGSTCNGCYAMKGRYLFSNVQTAQYGRLEAINDPRWTDAMVYLIERTGDPFFRWHDSGDLQSVDHLAKIVEIAERLPAVTFWIPTREYRILRDWRKAGGIVPANLTIRVSAPMIGRTMPNSALPYSTVTRDDGADVGGDAHVCPSRHQGNSCGDCRACWDPAVKHVSYPVH